MNDDVSELISVWMGYLKNPKLDLIVADVETCRYFGIPPCDNECDAGAEDE